MLLDSRPGEVVSVGIMEMSIRRRDEMSPHERQGRLGR